jgi:hypothetical protein
MIKKEIKALIDEFDSENKEFGIPSLAKYIEAFEKYSGKKKFDIELVGDFVIFRLKGVEYMVDTYQGLKTRLQSYHERDSYSELYTETYSHIWAEIYDSDIDKDKFLPVLLRRWEDYWVLQEKEYPNNDFLKRRKQESLNQFQLFTAIYGGNIIKRAEDIDDMELYPLVVMTMLDIFDKNECFTEYCEYEFNAIEYESVLIDENNNEGEIFFIKEYE